MLGLALRFFDFWSGRNRRASMSPFKNMSLIYFYITEQVGRSRAQRLVLDRQNRATEHHFYFNLYFTGVFFIDQLGFSPIVPVNHFAAPHLFAFPVACSKAERGDPLGNGGQLLLIASRASARGTCQGRKTTSMSTDRRGMSCTNRLIAVPPFIAKISLAKTSGATASSRRTISA